MEECIECSVRLLKLVISVEGYEKVMLINIGLFCERNDTKDTHKYGTPIFVEGYTFKYETTFLVKGYTVLCS